MSDGAETMPEIRWHKLRRDQLSAVDARAAALLLPVGAVEQHGPHLPLDTDIDAATAIAERAARLLTDPPTLVLPPIWWGLSPYWMPFAGTITLRPETILALITDIGRAVAHHGFHRLVIVNGHGGNAGILGAAATQLADYGIRAVALSYWTLIEPELRQLAPGDLGFIGHAGQNETSIQLYLQPDLVQQDLATADLCTPMDQPPWRSLIGGGYAPPEPLTDAPHGVYGDAPGGRAEVGRQLIELAAARLADVVRVLPLGEVTSSSPATSRPGPAPSGG